MRRLALALLAGTAVAVALAPVARAGGQAGRTRVAHFTATDGKGAVVTDLKAEEISVKDGGRDRAIVSVAPATAPMQVSVIVDDGGTGAFQKVLALFVEAMRGRAAFAITALAPGAVQLTDFTSDAGQLTQALSRVGGSGRMAIDPNALVEAIAGAAGRLQQRKAERPVILALTLNGEDTAPDTADDILKQLQSSGAMLNFVYLTSARSGPVLGDGPKRSGGIAEGIGGTPNLPAAMTRILDHLTNQYAVTYTLPDGQRPGDRLSVATTRKGMKIVAPTHIPNR